MPQGQLRLHPARGRERGSHVHPRATSIPVPPRSNPGRAQGCIPPAAPAPRLPGQCPGAVSRGGAAVSRGPGHNQRPRVTSGPAGARSWRLTQTVRGSTPSSLVEKRREGKPPFSPPSPPFGIQSLVNLDDNGVRLIPLYGTECSATHPGGPPAARRAGLPPSRPRSRPRRRDSSAAPRTFETPEPGPGSSSGASRERPSRCRTAPDRWLRGCGAGRTAGGARGEGDGGARGGGGGGAGPGGGAGCGEAPRSGRAGPGRAGPSRGGGSRVRSAARGAGGRRTGEPRRL